MVHPVGVQSLHAFGLKAEVAIPEAIGISWSPIGFPGPINAWAGCPGPNGWMHHHGDAGGIVTPAPSVRPERLPHESLSCSAWARSDEAILEIEVHQPLDSGHVRRGSA